MTVPSSPSFAMLSAQPPSTTLQIQRLVSLRWVAIMAQVLVISGASRVLYVSLPVQTMLGICLLMAGINVLTHWRLLQARPTSQQEVFVQLLLDGLALCGLLYFSGGAGNPFVSLLLLPLTIAATVLPLRRVWLMALFTFSAYVTLQLWYQPLTPSAQGLDNLNALICSVTGLTPAQLKQLAHNTGNHDSGFALHMLGMGLNFVISGLILTIFLTRMARALRTQEQALTKAREQTLRNEQILALGTLAAGAAHQLGTPLSTMAVITHDLQLDHADQPELAADLALLRGQIDQCKNILSELLDQAGQSRSEARSPQTINILAARLLDEWSLLRPGISIKVHQQAGNVPAILADRTLDQALLNLLNNAADASPVGLELALSWNDHQACFEIHDNGPGIPHEIAQRLGEAFFSTKRNTGNSGNIGSTAPASNKIGGMGIGLFLSNATLERLGGTVELANRPEGGTRTRICLPVFHAADLLPI